MKTFLTYFGYLIFKTVFHLKGKVLRLKKIKKEMLSVINTIYGLDLNQDNYKYAINHTPGFSFGGQYISGYFTYVINGKNGERFAASQIKDNELSFKIYLNNYIAPIGLPVLFGLNQTFQSLSQLFNIQHNLYLIFKNGTFKEVNITLELVAKNQAVYIERTEQPPKRIDISIHLDMQSNMKLDYTACLISFKNTIIHHNSLPLNELFKLIRLQIIDDLDVIKQITEILPELNIPSAYDFTSDDFKHRLLLVEMFQY
jgi:hypothetical protein